MAAVLSRGRWVKWFYNIDSIQEVKIHPQGWQNLSILLSQYHNGWSPDHLTHWGRVTHICVSELTIIGSNNGLSPGRRQAIIWTNAGILLTEPLGTNFSEILIEIHAFSFKKMHLKMSSAKWRLFRLGLNVLRSQVIGSHDINIIWLEYLLDCT